jgi:cytochrome c-type biogenesis protein CcmH
VIRVLLIALWLAAAPAFADDDAMSARLKSLETQLRCLVCQNQTLAESEAPLAADLRNEVRKLAQSGKSDDDIRAYLVARYGDFVLYKPPVKPVTYLLWFGPFVLLAAGIAVWWSVLRRRAARSKAGGEATEHVAAANEGSAVAQARALLDE